MILVLPFCYLLGKDYQTFWVSFQNHLGEWAQTSA